MIPVGALIAAAVIAARYAAEKNAAKDGTTSTTVTTRRTFQGRSSLFGLVWLFAWPLWLGMLSALVVHGYRPAPLAIVVVLTPLCIPWPLVRFVAIPLGLPRTAWFLAHLADWTWGRDRSGGALVAAVLAARAPPSHLAVRRRRRDSDIAWVRARLQRETLISAGGVVAGALLADLDGDHDRADALFDTLPSFDPRVVPKTARAIAVERHIAQLLQAGDWAAVAALDSSGFQGVGFSRFGRFARACARRVAGARAAPSPETRAPRSGAARAQVEPRGTLSDLRLRALWLVAPRRRRSLPLLRRALAADLASGADKQADKQADQRADQPIKPTATATTSTTDDAPLPRALALHVAITEMTEPTLADVAALAAAWDPALKAARKDLTTRARALGVHDVDGVARGVDDTVTAALCSLVQRLDLSDVDIKSQPALLQLAVDEVRSERLDALEIATAALRLRVESQIDLAPIDELREFAAMRALYESVRKTGSDARALSWDAAQWTLCEVAVRLWNTRQEHRLANAMFRWLLAEATGLGDTRGIETQTGNVKCGP